MHLEMISKAATAHKEATVPINTFIVLIVVLYAVI